MEIRKLFKAEMAHAVPGAYTTRCHYLHGHSYIFELIMKSATPNPAMMVADFKGIKDMGINDFFDSFDHTVTLWEKDPNAGRIAEINPNRHLVVPFVPTAEMLAKACFEISQAILDTGPVLSGEKGVLVEEVIVHETATGWGRYRRADLADDQFPPTRLSDWVISAGIKKVWKTPDWYEKAKKRFSK